MILKHVYMETSQHSQLSEAKANSSQRRQGHETMVFYFRGDAALLFAKHVRYMHVCPVKG